MGGPIEPRCTYHSASLCDVLTICGKSMTTGSPLSRLMRMLNSLKSPWMSPARAKRTMRSMSVEYSAPGAGTSAIWRLKRRRGVSLIDGAIQAAGKGLTTAYRGYASMNSMRMQCLAWSTGRGTGKACSCRTWRR